MTTIRAMLDRFRHPPAPVRCERTAAELHSLAARGVGVTESIWTAYRALFVPDSLAAQAAGDSMLMAAINAGLLLVALFGAADILWRDIRGRLILPSLSPHIRRVGCIAVWSLLAVGFTVRALIQAGDTAATLVVGTWYAGIGVWLIIEAAAIAAEPTDTKTARGDSDDHST